MISSDTLKEEKCVSFENHIVIERKNSLDELAICFTKGRERFENEFKRKSEAGSNCILLIENDNLKKLRGHTYRSNLSPKSFEASIWSWKHRYDYEVFFCDSKDVGLYIYNVFYYYVRSVLKGEIDA